MVGQKEFMDVHDAWVRGKSINEIARQTGRDPETMNFWPRVRDYQCAHDLLGTRRRWLDETCNVRIHGTTGERPVDRLAKECLRSIQDLPPYHDLGSGTPTRRSRLLLSATPAVGTRRRLNTQEGRLGSPDRRPARHLRPGRRAR